MLPAFSSFFAFATLKMVGGTIKHDNYDFFGQALTS